MAVERLQQQFYKEAEMKNKEIREAAAAGGVRLWEIAERYGITDGNFSRKLRRELSDEERERVLSIIGEIVKERA